jgi:hypothetical protein
VRLLRWPLVRLTRGLVTRAVVFCTRGKADISQPESIVRGYASMYPRKDEASAEILHEVRQEGYLTWPLLMPCEETS